MVDYMNARGMCPNCGGFRGWNDGPPHRCPEKRGATLSFSELRAVNESRCRRWHDPESWSVSDWAVAMLGEAGEACNAIKKLNRVRDGIANINDPGRQLTDNATAVAAIAEELADTLIYMDLLAQRLGIDLAAEVIRKFNITSERYGFPERLKS